MNSLHIAQTKSTPGVDFLPDERLVRISGVSTPINAFEFYDQIIQWVQSMRDRKEKTLSFFFHLPYFNSASMKGLHMLLEAIKEGIITELDWKVKWVVEAEDEFMQDAADSFQELLNVPIEIVEE